MKKTNTIGMLNRFLAGADFLKLVPVELVVGVTLVLANATNEHLKVCLAIAHLLFPKQQHHILVGWFVNAVFVCVLFFLR